MTAKSTKYPLISITMLNWNGLEDTKNCLKSLRKTTYPNYEVIIIDNGSSDGSKEWLRGQKDLVLVDLEKNYGVTGGHIKGYEVAKGEYIANLNNDTVVDPDWLWALYRPMEKDKNIAVTGGKAFEWNDNNPAYDETNEYFTYQVLDLYGGYAHTMRTGKAMASINSISTVGALMRRSAIEKVGYFDDDYFAYYDETDLFSRMKRAGYKIIYTPEAKLWHQIGASTKGFPYFYLYQMHRNRFFYAVKNYDREYVWPFIKTYTKDSLVALKLLLRGSKETYVKAQVKAYFWNLLHWRKSFSKRKEIMKLGPTLNKLLLDDAAEYVSVVIPCYNYEKYVGRAIESALNQTQQPLEIIVINDGSTDKSMDVIQKYEGRVRIIDKKNEGIIKTKNLGLIEAKGEWIIFLDADDELQPNYIEKCLRYAREHRFDVVYTDMQYIGAVNKEVKSKHYTFTELLRGNYIHNSSLYRKALLHKVHGYKLEMAGGYEDWELNISLHEAGAKFGYVEEAIFNYQQHEGLISRNASAQKQAHDLMKTVRRLHRKSYIFHMFATSKLLRVLRQIARNPGLPFYALLVLPLCVLAAIKAYFVTFKARLSMRLHRYIDARDDARKNAKKQ